MLLASGGWPRGWVGLWIVLCMIFARTAAMAFNRWADWHLDQANPRTANRAKLATRRQLAVLFSVSVVLFIACAAAINLLCFVLSPLAVMIFCVYSLMKRFSSASHLVLGLALSCAPIGAWIAVEGHAWDPLPWLIGATVIFWVAGFDIIYATQDIESDRALKLHSIPARFGWQRSLWIARVLHLMAWLIGLLVGLNGDFHEAYYGIWTAVGIVLIAQHYWAQNRTPASIQRAFFYCNIIISHLFLAATILEVWILS